MTTELKEQIKQWLNDFNRQDTDGEFAVSDGDLTDRAYDIFENLLKEKEGKFPISYLTRGDLEDAGYDTENVTDEQIERIASRMDKYYSEGYCESFMQDLECAADYVGLDKLDY